MKQASVIICAHNPRTDYLARVISALRCQTLSLDQWELIVVDNHSEPPLPTSLATWHPNGRAIREDELGKMRALIRGIHESSTPLIIIVDDDNVLAPDYLQVAIAKADKHPHLGAFCGCLEPEFEVKPPAQIVPYLHYLACHSVSEDRWANFDCKFTPSGAGMVVRSDAARYYVDLVSKEPLRKALERRGRGVASCEDHDMALASTEIGYGIGMLKDLRLTHLISADRLTEDYVIRYFAGVAQGNLVLQQLYPRFRTSLQPGRMATFARFVWHYLRSSRFERRALIARHRAERTTRKMLRKVNSIDHTAPNR